MYCNVMVLGMRGKNGSFLSLMQVWWGLYVYQILGYCIAVVWFGIIRCPFLGLYILIEIFSNPTLL